MSIQLGNFYYNMSLKVTNMQNIIAGYEQMFISIFSQSHIRFLIKNLDMYLLKKMIHVLENKFSHFLIYS